MAACRALLTIAALAAATCSARAACDQGDVFDKITGGKCAGVNNRQRKAATATPQILVGSAPGRLEDLIHALAVHANARAGAATSTCTGSMAAVCHELLLVLAPCVA